MSGFKSKTEIRQDGKTDRTRIRQEGKTERNREDQAQKTERTTIRHAGRTARAEIRRRSLWWVWYLLGVATVLLILWGLKKGGAVNIRINGKQESKGEG